MIKKPELNSGYEIDRDFLYLQILSQAAQAQCVSLIINTCSFKIAVNIKDLYGNSGKRFKSINTR